MEIMLRRVCGAVRPRKSFISATPVAGKFTIRFNKALTANTYVVWMVLN